MAKEIILGGVPREDLDDEGNFLEGREEYNRKFNQSWGGYRGEDAEDAGAEVAEDVEASEQAPAPRRRRSAPVAEVAPEAQAEQPQEAVEQEQAPEPAEAQAPEQA